VEPRTPAPIVDLPAGEVIFKTAPVRIAASPGAFGGLDGVAVLTSERLVVVPGAAGAPAAQGNSLQRTLLSLWEKIKPTLLEAFPVVRLLVRSRAVLAARARPGIEIPLDMIRRAFEAHPAGWLGVELALPHPDPRPPFALYFRIDSETGGSPREWAQLIEGHKHAAPSHPDLERPYALFYLLRPLPRPQVRVRSSDGRRHGTLVLHPDGPAIAGPFSPERVLFPYESITRLVLASSTPWRRSWLRIEAGEHVTAIHPYNEWDAGLLHDCAHLIAEVAGVPLHRQAGDVRTGRVLTAIATVAGTVAAVAWQILHSLP
jgi:hypothetical protein